MTLARVRSAFNAPWIALVFGTIYVLSQTALCLMIAPLGTGAVLRMQCTFFSAGDYVAYFGELRQRGRRRLAQWQCRRTAGVKAAPGGYPHRARWLPARCHAGRLRIRIRGNQRAEREHGARSRAEDVFGVRSIAVTIAAASPGSGRL